MITSSFEAATAMKLPDTLETDGILVGWSQELSDKRQPMGFNFGNPELTPEKGWIDPILLNREGHLITIAPTGTGKGRGCIIPALLRHDGPVIVIDPKGENVSVTARRRREMGHKVIVIDPMGVTDEPSSAFNPLDLIDINTGDAVDIASMMAAALIDGKDDPKNRYWYQRSQFLLTALILHIKTNPDPTRHTFLQLRETLDLFSGTDAQDGSRPGTRAYALMNSPHPEARRAANQMFGRGGMDSITSIISMANDGVDFLRGPLLEKSLSRTDFDFNEVTLGAPLSIYLVLPPHMLESHGRLLRLWVNTLLSLITRRRGRPEKSTLFILDECAQLGSLPQLRQIITLLRGYGVQSWSFWQDVSQLQMLYPNDWQTMINNCAVVQCFGALNLMAASSMAAISGFGDGQSVLGLDDHEMILQIAGDTPVMARKPDYLNDPAFKGMFDKNPYHDPNQPILPPTRPQIKADVRPHLDLERILPRPYELTPDEIHDIARGHAEKSFGAKLGKRRVVDDPLLKRLLAMWDE